MTGKTFRLARLSRHADDRYLFVPLDHSVSDGPIAPAGEFPSLVANVCANGADAVVLHKGRARLLDPQTLCGSALVIHLSASTIHAPDGNAKILVGAVEEALTLGADAVSVHVNLGSATERDQLADLGLVARDCERWGVPLLAMMYLRGPNVVDPGQARLLAHSANVAADLGADIVKTVVSSPIEDMAGVVAESPLPIVVAGGPGGALPLEDFAMAAVDAGCHGLAVGRRVFGNPEPGRTVRRLADIVHGAALAVPTPLRSTLVGAR